MAREITPAQVAAVGRYESKTYDKVLLRMPKGQREIIKAAADAAGESLNAYVLHAIQSRMDSQK